MLATGAEGPGFKIDCVQSFFQRNSYMALSRAGEGEASEKEK